jgi:hypothetical protein
MVIGRGVVLVVIVVVATSSCLGLSCKLSCLGTGPFLGPFQMWMAISSGRAELYNFQNGTVTRRDRPTLAHVFDSYSFLLVIPGQNSWTSYLTLAWCVSHCLMSGYLNPARNECNILSSELHRTWVAFCT